MSYADLREWLQLVDGMGQLTNLEGAHWDLEIGAITDMVAKSPNRKPALLFDDIVDHPHGFRVLTSSLNSLERLALTCGLSTDMTDMDFVRGWAKHVARTQPIPPREVTTGPVLENVVEGDAVDLTIFPSPKWNESDGGRFPGTGSIVITRDPEDESVNIGCYRVQLFDEKSVGMWAGSRHGGNMHRRKWFERGLPCPVVVSFGHDPLLLMAGATPLPVGQSELDWAGGIRKEPVEVIRGPLTGLPIPAFSEIAIEGYLMPDDYRPEGPFGEFTGYYASGQRPEPAIHVKRLMYRDNPIILGAPRGRPPDDPTFWQTRLRASGIWAGLEGAGVPEVQGVWCHNPNIDLFTVVAIKQQYGGHARQAGLIAQQCAGGLGMSRWCVVVDEDIDPSNIDDVLWAMATRADPERAIEITHYSTNSQLDSARAPGNREHASRAVIEACRPWEWRDRFPKVAQTNPEVVKHIRQKWMDKVWSEKRVGVTV